MISYLLFFLLGSFQFAQASSAEFENWIETQTEISLVRMKANLSPAGTTPGVVIASPSKQDPDYFFHWIRDAALVMDSVLLTKDSSIFENDWLKLTEDYVAFSEKLLQTPSPTGIGEPRYQVDGTAFWGAWARPQHDGPGLQALNLLRILEILDSEPPSLKRTQVTEKIHRILRIDLQFILEMWREPSFDLWEEVKGQHFYTRVAQLQALEKAIERMKKTGESFARPAECQRVRDRLALELGKHWNPEEQFFVATRDRLEGAESYKFTELDVSIVLAALHSQRGDGDFSLTDDRILATAAALERKFSEIYAINHVQTPESLAPAIGRYADDVYFGGNPWYLTTAAFAELHYKLATALEKRKSLSINEINLSFFRNAGSGQVRLKIGMKIHSRQAKFQKVLEALRKRGDHFLARIQKHTPADGSLSEQFGRDDGRSLSARDLTWSYAAFLTAVKARTAHRP